ncbi:MAG: TIR domain-containing protein [Candidatus Brocadiaceae bacterium]|nr:TIR domain-containing protein [Candidatus Brocadiaceae bacterium]
MSYVPEFENDIFISYSHIDNEPLTEGQVGWIEEFHRTLYIRLNHLGVNTSIWCDPEIQGNDIFNDTLVEKLHKVAVLIPVLSPNYIKSDWCIKELKEFYQAAEKSQCLSIENKSRIFKVLKIPVEHQKHPQELQGMIGYNFFLLDKNTQKAIDFYNEKGGLTVDKFLERINDLAHDIKNLLGNLRKIQTGETIQTNEQCIYLAETSTDLTQERDNIKRELKSRGYTVLPDTELSIRSADRFNDEVLKYLKKCKLSIHMIGANYGSVPEGANNSLVHLQNELAAGSMNGHTLTRLIWIPKGLQGKEIRQQEFIEMLHSDSNFQKGADLLETPLEELKTTIFDKLEQKAQKPGQDTSDQDCPKRIYLVCSSEDYEDTNPLEEYLYKQGFEVILPIFEGDEETIYREHNEFLADCDSVLIFYGKTGERWVRSKIDDLQKALGYGRKTAFSAKAVYCTTPETSHKNRLKSHGISVIKDFGLFSPDTLKPFIKQIEENIAE